MTSNKITVENTIAAPVERVWQCYTQPEHITNWNFATDDWQCPIATNDLRPGGKYSARMEAKDGSFGFDFEGIYDEVKDQQQLTFTMPNGRQTTTRFEDLGGSTKVTTTFDPEDTHDREMQRAGWQAILDNFKRYVEKSR